MQGSAHRLASYLVLYAWGLLAACAVLPSLQGPDGLSQPLPWVSSRGAEGGQQRGWAMLHYAASSLYASGLERIFRMIA